MAKVKVKGEDGNWHVANLLFDSGSDRSYVNYDVVKFTKPKWIGNSEVSFSTFGGGSHDSKSKIFELCLKGMKGGEETKVELLEVPVICSPLAKPVVSAELLEKFEHLDLAYDFEGQGELNVDILIGQDLFWSLMGSVLVREKSCIVAQETAFGWVLSGSSSTNSNDGVTLLNICTSDESGRLIAGTDVGVSEEFESHLGLRDACEQTIGEVVEDGTGVFGGIDGVCDSLDPFQKYGLFNVVMEISFTAF